MDFENTLKNHEFQLPENWNYYMCQIDEMPASYFVNLALAEIAPISQRLQLIWLEIKMNQPREDGLSLSEEFDHLMVFEDEIIPSLINGSQSIYVGRLTHNKIREFYFYCENATVLKHKIQLIMQKFSQYSYQTGHRDEPDWSSYFKCMYPTPEILQTISNRAVVENLLHHGDRLQIARPVCHWLFFQNETDLAECVLKTQALGFEVVQIDQLDDEHMKFSLQISRIDHVDQYSIDRCTLELFELCKLYNAEYDGWETEVVIN